MLIFGKWYAQKYGYEYEYTDDETDTEVAKAYLAYRKSFSCEMSFHDAWYFLDNHPIFKGCFNEHCLDIRPTIDDDLGPCILLETCIYIENDYTVEEITDEFILVGNASLDVWALTFEDAIRELALLIKTEYGEYTDDESTLSELELVFGKEQAPIQFSLIEAQTAALEGIIKNLD